MNKPILEIVRQTLDSFHENNINYCHFKSNEHVDAAVCGDTDLDILFDINQKDQILVILGSLGYIKYNTVWFVSYPCVEDYIIIAEGKVVHIHAHYKLILGESKVKSYILEWEKEFFKTRIFMDEFGIYASSPIEESLLLIVRTALKLSPNKEEFDKSKDTKDATREFEWLKRRVKKEELLELFEKRFKNIDAEVVADVYDHNINYENILKFYLATKDTLDQYRRYSYLSSKVVKFLRQNALKIYWKNRKFQIFPNIVNHRVLPNSGVVIAIMGADGSGKSTQINMLRRILLTKMDVRAVYLGSGKGKASWHRNIIKFIRRSFFKPQNINLIDNKKQNGKKSSFIRKAFWILNTISLAIEKNSKLNMIKKLKKKGFIVISDRYPQISVYGYNDGPLMPTYSDSSGYIIKLLTRFEISLYKKAETIYPDIVIKLLGNPEILHDRRKEEITKEMLIKKQEGIKNITFGEKTKVFEIDAILPIKEITRKIVVEVGHLASEKNKIAAR